MSKVNQKYKIIIDTDIGDDIDDAVALLGAMKQGFEIVGITTVFRNSAERARLVKKLLKSFGNGYENVPVYAGYGDSFDGTVQPKDHLPHYTKDVDLPEFEPEHKDPSAAVDFIIESCRKYGKELAVVAIGPFTNIAKAIEKDVEALNGVSKVVVMGGAYLKQYADWNVMCDVEAADMMFKNLSNLECIGADVTHTAVAPDFLYERIVNYSGESPAGIYLREMCDRWKIDRPAAKLILHDPLTVYYLSDARLCTMKKANVAVITEGFARGMTLNIDSYGKRDMNREAYDDSYISGTVLYAEKCDKETLFDMIYEDFE